MSGYTTWVGIHTIFGGKLSLYVREYISDTWEYFVTKRIADVLSAKPHDGGKPHKQKVS